jgi:hypothetical protein
VPVSESPSENFKKLLVLTSLGDDQSIQNIEFTGLAPSTYILRAALGWVVVVCPYELRHEGQPTGFFLEKLKTILTCQRE